MLKLLVYFITQVLKDVLPSNEAWFPWSSTLESLSNYVYWNYWSKWWKPILRWNRVGDHLMRLKRKANTYQDALLIVPGMNGTINCHYVQQFIHEFALSLLTDVFVVAKGDDKMGEHACTKYVEDAMLYLQENGYKNVCIVGFSAGALSTVKYMSKNTDNEMVRSGILIASGFNLKSISEYISPCWSKALYWCMYHKVGKTLQQADIEKATELGYSNVDDFYKDHSCHKDLVAIKVPLYIIASYDDPVIANDNWRDIYVAQSYNNNIRPIISSHGGHLGWRGGKWLHDTLLREVLQDVSEW